MHLPHVLVATIGQVRIEVLGEHLATIHKAVGVPVEPRLDGALVLEGIDVGLPGAFVARVNWPVGRDRETGDILPLALPKGLERAERGIGGTGGCPYLGLQLLSTIEVCPGSAHV